MRHALAAAIMLLAACGARPSSAEPEIYTAGLSPDATKAAVIVIDKADRTRTELLIYDIASASFTNPPALEAGWYPNSASFSGDNRHLAVSADCPRDCTDETDLSRLLVLDMTSNEWRTLVSGPGRRSAPSFLAGDEGLLFVNAELFVSKPSGQLLSLNPKPAVADMATGEINTLDVDIGLTTTMYQPTFGPDGAIYFSTIMAGTRDPRLVAA